MRATAARLVTIGEPLEVTEIDLPAPGDDEVEIDMLYGGVNPVDRYRATGAVNRDAPLPRTLGAEGVGIVEGRHVVVFGHGVGAVRDGIWATKAVVPRASLVTVPQGVDPEHAAVMGVAGVTAWRTVTDLARVEPDDRVLVLGASGGVGSLIVSLVHGIGATVWGQSRNEGSAEWLNSQGADRVVVAGPEDLAERVAELRPSVVFDPLGGGFTGAAIGALAPRGRLVTFGTSSGATGTIPLQTLYRSALHVMGYAGQIDSAEVLDTALAAVLGALADRRIDVVIDRTLPLDQVNEAFELLVRRGIKGKLVLDLRG